MSHLKVPCLNVFCCHCNKSTVLLFNSIFRTTPEISTELYLVEISEVSEKLWLFNHKIFDPWHLCKTEVHLKISKYKMSSISVRKEINENDNSRLAISLSKSRRKQAFSDFIAI